jgi:hypothetical protein
VRMNSFSTVSSFRWYCGREKPDKEFPTLQGVLKV